MDFNATVDQIKTDIASMKASSATLENKNLFDIFAAAEAKILQALSHPDIDAAMTAHDAMFVAPATPST